MPHGQHVKQIKYPKQKQMIFLSFSYMTLMFILMVLLVITLLVTILYDLPV